MQIWKFELERSDKPQTIKMPKGAKILHTAKQLDWFCMWAEVEPHNDTEERTFLIIATDEKYFGTYVGIIFDKPFVWHIIEN